ncbi:carbohydrate ABC transporter permease [Aquipuribacter nitratireducens]|uniref:Carbohydrate ABC transporter permease n=1 Tax=Aquipuribacter nitratireducens TaxID=650104 RepID=A0ABW0GMI1_9MICO
MDLLLNANSAGEKFTVMIIAILLFVAVMTIILFAVDRPRNVPGWLAAIAFAGPALLLLIFGLVRPALITIYQAFFDRTGENFVGTDNLAQIFATPDLRQVIYNTFAWTILTPLVATFLGLLYAVLVDKTRFEAVAKALIFLPMAISMVGASIIWRFVYDYRADIGDNTQIGLANQVLVWLGFEPYQFLLQQPWNTVFLIIVFIWIQTGFAMTVLSAAIKAIPDDITEAAKLDGVSGVQLFRFVTVPAIRPALIVVLTTLAIGSLKVFDIVRTMTGGQFGTSIVANEFYTQAFRQGDQGLGAALALILFILVVPIVAYNVRQQRISEEVR